MKTLMWISLVMRWIMEAGIVVGLGYWGFHAGGSAALKILLLIAAPVLVFSFWGFVDFRWLGKPAEVVRLIQELAITALVTAALVVTGQTVLGWLFAGISIVHHVLVYVTGDRLIKEKT
jgi:hypothetical protein